MAKEISGLKPPASRKTTRVITKYNGQPHVVFYCPICFYWSADRKLVKRHVEQCNQNQQDRYWKFIHDVKGE